MSSLERRIAPSIIAIRTKYPAQVKPRIVDTPELITLLFLCNIKKLPGNQLEQKYAEIIKLRIITTRPIIGFVYKAIIIWKKDNPIDIHIGKIIAININSSGTILSSPIAIIPSIIWGVGNAENPPVNIENIAIVHNKQM